MRARVLVFWSVLIVLLAPAATLTFARAVEPDGGFWIRLEAFTPLALALYAAAAVLLALRILVRRRWHSAGTRLTGGVLLLAVGGLALHAWWFAPLVTGANPPAAQGADPVVVMSANVARGHGDAVEVVRTAMEEDVDLLVLQEITTAELADMERAGLDDLLPYRVGEPGLGSNDVMVFARTELTPVAPDPTWPDGWVVAWGDLTVVAAHPHAPTEPDLWRSAHDALHAVVVDREADLVVGDLNATADHAPVRALADAGLRDVGELANQGWQPTWPSSGAVDVLGVPVPSLAQIDHVLVGPRLAAISMHTRDIPGSDHRAVIAVVAPK